VNREYLPEWVERNLDCGCMGCRLRLKNAFNTAMEALITAKHMTVISSSPYNVIKDYIKRIEEIGSKG